MRRGEEKRIDGPMEGMSYIGYYIVVYRYAYWSYIIMRKSTSPAQRSLKDSIYNMMKGQNVSQIMEMDRRRKKMLTNTSEIKLDCR